MPRLGLGTWRMGEKASERKAEVAALGLGLDLGLTLIDTAEMYAEGGAEEVVGEAIKNRRDEVFLISKVLPENASRKGTIEACERSLRHLKTGRIDLYLLHWQGAHPLRATLDAFEQLVDDGKIRFYGVSNFDLAAMKGLARKPNGANVVSNQVLYSLTRRGVDYDVVPWCAGQKISVMAYCPLDQGSLKEKGALKTLARRHDVAPATIAIAWTMRQAHLCSIPKATNPDHVRANAAALSVALSEDDLAELDRDYPPPRSKTPLAMS
ncbi:MAG: aldo/keto reductase [Proteobacteria bacterium]|nr:aldo/keto reductase [Pseudomonadota bacterium]